MSHLTRSRCELAEHAPELQGVFDRLRAADALRDRWRTAVAKDDRLAEFKALAALWALLERGYGDVAMHLPESGRAQLEWLLAALTWLADERPSSVAVRDLRASVSALWLRYATGGTA